MPIFGSLRDTKLEPRLGALLETAVYLELRRRMGPLSARAISYHRTATGKEVDFVVDSPVPDQGRHFIQVCLSLEGAQAEERETSALVEALASVAGATATIVTRADRGELQTPSGVVEVLPFWEWALRGPVAAALR